MMRSLDDAVRHSGSVLAQCQYIEQLGAAGQRRVRSVDDRSNVLRRTAKDSESLPRRVPNRLVFAVQK